jgi:hypothetical protein
LLCTKAPMLRVPETNFLQGITSISGRPLCALFPGLTAKPKATNREGHRCRHQYERRNELFSIEAEARPNHWAVFTLGCRAILAPMTYSSQIGFGLASQGIDRQPLPSLRSDRFQLSVGGRLYETPTSSVFWG